MDTNIVSELISTVGFPITCVNVAFGDIYDELESDYQAQF